ncbi:hypothetical protein Avbf_02066 [Armadillidium vulgare]|nr:hypothetical protein Avbf_02066 [Armadillidium vulgare]
MGPSSLSSSVISSVSLDEAGLNSLNKYQNCGSCVNHPCPSRDLNTKSVAKVKSSHYHTNSSEKVSPSYSRISPNSSKSPPPNLSKDESSIRQNCCCKYLTSKQNNEKIKTNIERRMPVWHNPSKGDKFNSSSIKKENSSFFKKYGFCRAKSEVRETNNTIDNKFSSLPRKKKEKNEKDIAAETYGTLGRNRKKKEVEKPKLVNERHYKDLPHESKNILDKYATLPRKKAKEMSARWRDLNSQKESKDSEYHPRLQRSKSIGKESSKSVRATPSPCLSSASNSAVNSPRNANISKPNTKLNLKIISPSARLLSKQNGGTSKEKTEKSPSPRIYFSNRQPKFAKNKKNAQVQVNLRLDPDENSLEERFRKLEEEYAILQTRLRRAEATSEEVEQMRMEAVDLRRQAENERLEKEELQQELEKTSGKVKEMLTSMEGVEKEFNNRGESLIELESQLHASADVNIQMQEKINQYEEYSIKLKKDLDKSLAAQKILLQQVQDLEAEGGEMVEFIAEEKNALSECLKEAELELCRQRKEIEDLKKKMQRKEEEANHMLRLAEERRIGYLSLQTELESLQTSTEDIMVCQGAQVSGASVGLTNLSNRLQILTGKLIQDYSISDNDIENIVTPVESDSSVSSATGTPDLAKSPIRSVNRTSSPRKPVSFMQSFLNAMRSAHSSSKLFLARAKNTEERGSPEGSEITTGSKEYCEEVKSPCQQNLADQVTEVDALLSRFLKVCCVLKSDADNILSDLEDENERLCSQIQLQQQMIDHQYAEFESLSNLECNARKELKLITKDLEFANATLNKVCDDDTKMRVKNVDEALREINLNLGRMDTMHAEKRERIAQARHKLPNAQSRMHWANSTESPKRKHNIHGSSHSRSSLCRHHWREVELHEK